MKWFILTLGLLALPLLAEEVAHPTPAAVKSLPDGSIYTLDSSWTDQDGKVVKWSESVGKTRVIALGYANCKGICPRIIADMQRIEKELSPEAKTRFTFITLDPKNDTSAELKALVGRHQLSPRWDLLRGEEDVLLEMAVVLGVRFDRLPNGIDFAHSYLIATVGKDGKILHKWTDGKEGPEASIQALKKEVP
ncbi:MAG: SCO family protein [Verrucomicrobiota bacterium]